MNVKKLQYSHAVPWPWWCCPSILIGWEMLAHYMIGWEDFLNAVPWPCRVPWFFTLIRNLLYLQCNWVIIFSWLKCNKILLTSPLIWSLTVTLELSVSTAIICKTGQETLNIQYHLDSWAYSKSRQCTVSTLERIY
jgi:hypothetical protein